MTSQRIRIFCPRCDRALRVREEDLGRTGLCKHCGHRFQAGLDDAELLRLRFGWPARGTDAERRGPKLEQRVQELESELRTVLSQLSSQSAQQASLLHALRDRGNQLAAVQHALGESYGPFPEELSLTDARAARAQVGDTRMQRREVQAPGAMLAYRSERRSPLAVDVEIGAEFDDDDFDVPPERCGPYDVSNAESESIVAALGTSFEFNLDPEDRDRIEEDERHRRARGGYAAERDTLAGEIARLRGRLSELESAFGAARNAFEADRDAWQTERRVFEARWNERHQAALAEDESRDAELQRTRTELQQIIDNGAAECRRISAERDALKRVVSRLRSQLADRSRSRAELEAELAHIRAEREAERARSQAPTNCACHDHEDERVETVEAQPAEALASRDDGSEESTSHSQVRPTGSD